MGGYPGHIGMKVSGDLLQVSLRQKIKLYSMSISEQQFPETVKSNQDIEKE